MTEADLYHPTIRERIEGWWSIWSYILGPRTQSQRYRTGKELFVGPWQLGELSWYEISRWEIIKCRYQGHPRGIVYYNPGGFEPDDHCKTCDERIG